MRDILTLIVRFLLLVYFFSAAYTAGAQNSLLNKIVALDNTSGTIEEILDELSYKGGFTFSYGNQIPVDKHAKVNKARQSVRDHLNDLFPKNEVEYIDLKNKILLRYHGKKKDHEEVSAKSRTISGYVKDRTNSESLINATVYDRLQNEGTLTNNFGFYSVSTLRDSVVLTFSYVGYDPQTIRLRVNHDTTMVILLRTNQLLDEVFVTETNVEPINETTRSGTVHVPVTQVKAVPAIMSEVDLFKALQLLPGVSGGAEGSSNLLVRGGNPDQTLVLLDGATIYNPNHLYGLMSTFNADAINNIELVKGGFPARYGGRLSGVVDVTLKEGNMNKVSGDVSLGLLASKLLLEGPIQKNRSSFMVSGRVGYLDVIKLANLAIDGYIDKYQFYDINMKLNHRINKSNRIYSSLYTGQDVGSFTYTNNSTDSVGTRSREITRIEKNIIQWRNTVASIRWNHEINKKLFFNLAGFTTIYKLQLEDINDTHSLFSPGGETADTYFHYIYTSSINDAGVKIDFDYIPNIDHYIRFGATALNHRFTPGVASTDSDDPSIVPQQFNTPVSTNEASVYVEDDFSITNATKINIGLHGVAYRTGSKTYFGVQPRVALRHAISPSLSFKASYSSMQQYLHILSNSGTGLPVDFWVPVTEKVKPQVSHQVSVGLAQTLGEKVEVSLDVYYKNMKNLIEYQEGASYRDAVQPWYTKIEQGRGRAYGAEFFVQKKVGRFSGWTGYTLSWNQRQFDNLNNGRWYYYRYDHRHDFKTTASFDLTRRWNVSATWIYTSGNAVTLGYERAPYDPFILDPGYHYQMTVLNENRNNFRMPAYHRLDVSAMYNFSIRNTKHRVTLSVYNAYNRSNPYYLDVVVDRSVPLIRTQPYLPLIPSISYSIKF